ncbi:MULTISPECIES: hypothetical protein [Burkholderiaceae]|nr:MULTISPECIES: hypothetical protein [Burkholderiaceae]MCW3698098.1 hypothetical protein [Burkholderia cenocepacia]MCW3705952.1 hypothetical protein [Burkholderia cenocepacia]MCW3714192.1 hypothetical protein [Burkholderia cenocepacia]MCW3722258.1 hypothetical protein [Burkholderia cenocepacia]MCW3730604.1 hypothetical protein [Burkholderia cenocepacia]
MWDSILRFMYALLIRVPILGDVVLIVNGYAYEGKHDALVRFAPPLYWLRRIVPKLALSGLFALWITCKLTSHFSALPKSATDFTGMLLSIFPNLLGFGIGVYALIFALPESFFKSLRGERETTTQAVEQPRSPQENPDTPPNMINADMAYPLIVIALSITFGAFIQFFMTMWSFYVSIWLLSYCFVLMLELISLIYVSAYKSISDKQ